MKEAQFHDGRRLSNRSVGPTFESGHLYSGRQSMDQIGNRTERSSCSFHLTLGRGNQADKGRTGLTDCAPDDRIKSWSRYPWQSDSSTCGLHWALCPCTGHFEPATFGFADWLHALSTASVAFMMYGGLLSRLPGPRLLSSSCRNKFCRPIRVQELCESRGGRPELPVLMSLMVSVDVKQH